MNLETLKEQVVDLQFGGVETDDAPKFTDAYVSDVKIDDNGTIREATDDEVELLNSDYAWLNEQVHQHLVGMMDV